MFNEKTAQHIEYKGTDQIGQFEQPTHTHTNTRTSNKTQIENAVQITCMMFEEMRIKWWWRRRLNHTLTMMVRTPSRKFKHQKQTRNNNEFEIYYSFIWLLRKCILYIYNRKDSFQFVICISTVHSSQFPEHSFLQTLLYNRVSERIKVPTYLFFFHSKIKKIRTFCEINVQQQHFSF